MEKKEANDNYESFQKRILIDIISQLPSESILAFSMPAYFVECSAYEKLALFRIEDNFSRDIIVPDCYFLITKESLSTYIEQIVDTDILAYICHYMIYKKNGEDVEMLVVVYDGCIFRLSDKIVIEDSFIKQCDSEGLYIDYL